MLAKNSFFAAEISQGLNKARIFTTDLRMGQSDFCMNHVYNKQNT